MRPTPLDTRLPLSCLAFFSMVAVGTLSSGCGDNEDPGVSVREGEGGEVDFGDPAVVIVTEEGTYIATGDPGDECVKVGETCVYIGDATGRYCDLAGTQADIVVVDGEVVDVICFPPDDEGTPIEEVAVEQDGGIDIPQPENGVVVVFDQSTDGRVIQGDLEINAERTTVYGNGIDVTILGGDVSVLSNNSRIREVTIQGDLRYESNANNSAISFAQVHGNLQVASNGFTAVEIRVFGDVQVDGNSAVLFNVGVQGAWQVNGSGPICSGCYSFSDENGDFSLQTEEVGAELTCG